MKKILFAITLMLMFSTNVEATSKTLTREIMEDIIYFRTGGNLQDGTGNHSIFRIDGELGYCIENAVKINTDIYYPSEGFISTPYTEEINKRIELIAYYGYNYKTHTDFKYHIATQALIWELTSEGTIIYKTGYEDSDTIIDISKEKEDILKYVDTHYDKPSFDNNTYSGTINNTITIVDSNSVLDFYTASSNDATITISNNAIYVTPTKIGNITITLTKKETSNIPSIIYIGSDLVSQIVGVYKSFDEVTSLLHINTTGGTVEINKLDGDTNTNTPSGEATLEGAIYGIFTENGTKITEIITDVNGFALCKDILDIGKYYIMELNPPMGYEIDTNKYYFEITNTNLEVTLIVKDIVIKGEITINKVYASSSTGIMTPEPNVTFGFYDINNNLITSVSTNAQGTLTLTLPYGTYKVKQLTTTNSYEKVEDFYITIDENNKSHTYILSDAKITAKLKVIKIDNNTKEVISMSNISFKIYDTINQQYICQNITYPNTEIICEYKTNEDGVLITPYPLDYGSYYLEEVDQEIIGYLWNEDKIYFNIDENSNIINDTLYGSILTIEFPNTEVKGSIEITKYGETIIFDNNTFSYMPTLLENVVFYLYAKEDIYSANKTLIYKKDYLIGSYTTNADGYIKIENLYLGEYYIKEYSTSNSYVTNNEIYDISLKYVDQYTENINYELTVYNYLKKSTFELTKIDIFTNEIIPNTLFEIYTFDDILIFSGYTNEFGKIIIENLFTGTFYAIEKEAANGYIQSNGKIYFEVTEDNLITELMISNEKISIDMELGVEIPLTESQHNNLLYNICYIITIIGGIYIAKNKFKQT